jgi:hypothetical protein
MITGVCSGTGWIDCIGTNVIAHYDKLRTLAKSRCVSNPLKKLNETQLQRHENPYGLSCLPDGCQPRKYEGLSIIEAYLEKMEITIKASQEQMRAEIKAGLKK